MLTALVLFIQLTQNVWQSGIAYLKMYTKPPLGSEKKHWFLAVSLTNSKDAVRIVNRCLWHQKVKV